MSRLIATTNFNKLYTMIRSSVSGRGLSTSIKAFNDGSCIVNISVSGANASVTLSVIVCAIYEDGMYSPNGKIKGYQCSNEDETKFFERIEDCGSFCRQLVAQTKIILAKI